MEIQGGICFLHELLERSVAVERLFIRGVIQSMRSRRR